LYTQHQTEFPIIKSSHSFEVVTFEVTWVKARGFEGQESFHTAGGPTDFLRPPTSPSYDLQFLNSLYHPYRTLHCSIDLK